MPESAHRLVSDLSDRIEELEVAFHEAYWDSQVEASPGNEKRRAELELELRKLKGDPRVLERVNEALAAPVHDDVLRRQLEVLRLSLTGNQMSDRERELVVELSSAVESDFASFRPEVRGKRINDNQIEEILKTSDDEDLRREAWFASKQVGGLVAERILELVRVRNEAAHRQGFANFYRMELELQEIPEGWLFEMMDELEAMTREPFTSWKEGLDRSLHQRFSTTDLFPWHYADPFFQNLPDDGRVALDDVFGDAAADELALRTFSAWDIDLRDVMSSSDLYPRENKCQHAFCLDVDRKGDVRLLCNVVSGERWVEVTLHESGHAAFDVSIDPALPYLLRRPAHIFVTEAMAILSGRLVHDPAWLRDIAGLDVDAIASLTEDLRRATAAQSRLFARWGLVMVHFERALYADPEGDLDRLWWELVERFQLLRPPEQPPVSAWAAKIHLAVAPVYYHNYLLGEMLASQVRATAEREFGGLVGSAEAGAMLRDRMFRPGDLLAWPALVEAICGRSLSAADLAADISIL